VPLNGEKIDAQTAVEEPIAKSTAWHTLKAQFRELQAQDNHGSPLCACWLSTGWKPGGQQRGQLYDGTERTLTRFPWLAELAALELGYTGTAESALFFWLDLLKTDGSNCRSFTGRSVEAGSVVESNSIVIESLCEASANYCERLADQASVREKRAQLVRPKGGPAAGLRSRPARKLRDTGPVVATWDAIEIWFLSDERIQIHIGANLETRNYAEMGFMDRRNGKPDQAWVTLRALAEVGGIIRTGSMGGLLSKVQRRVQEIRKALRTHFGIVADPIPFVEGSGYQARFKIGCTPSFHT
jgi:hypothetical protein